MVKRTPRARSLLGCMHGVCCRIVPIDLFCELILPLSGVPCPPFYRPRGSRGYRWKKEENTKGIEGPLKDPGLPFSLRLPCITWQTVSEVACSLIFVGHALASFSKWVRPIPPLRAACRTGLLISDPMGSGWRGDCSFVTVGDGSPRLEHSGCRMFVSGSSPM